MFICSQNRLKLQSDTTIKSKSYKLKSRDTYMKDGLKKFLTYKSKKNIQNIQYYSKKRIRQIQKKNKTKTKK